MPAKRELRGPSNFCEWVVGTTIPSILGPEKRTKKQKSTRRSVIRVEVTTDDESEEDTLKISYPRSRGRRKKASAGGAAKAKKVHFEEVPRKSALKHGTKAYTIAESPEDDEKTSDSSGDASSDSSASGILLIPQNIRVHTVKVFEDPKNENSSIEESEANSEADSDPSPTCKCINCIRGRQKLSRRRRRAALFKKLLSASEDTSDSETDESDEVGKGGTKEKGDKKKGDENKDQKKIQKSQKKEKLKSAAVDTSDSESEAKSGAGDDGSEVEESEEESNMKSQHQSKKEKKNKGYDDGKDAPKKGKDKGERKKDEKKADKAKEKSEGKSEKEVASETKTKEKKAKDKSKAYPAAMPGPHPRRPNLIEPIRAEVVQLERVIEGPEDPPPNSYFDAGTSVLRHYHGPVYGGFQIGELYPVRDPKTQALPLGSAHPLQNPYFHGFQNEPPRTPPRGQYDKTGPQWPGPAAAWPGMPWQYAPPFAPVPHPPGMAPADAARPAPPPAPPVSGSKGAFSDRAGKNNVAPGSVEGGKPNPYYKQQTSPFSAYNKASPSYGRQGPGSKAGSRQASATGWNNDGAAAGSVKQSSLKDGWGNAGAGQTQEAPDTWGGSQTQQHTMGEWGTNQIQEGMAQQDSWAAGTQRDQVPQGWGAGDGQNQTATWPEQQHCEEPTVASTESNVMPGTFDPPATWGDVTMAADTHGAVDRETVW